MAKNITLMGASYSDVPAVQLPQTGGGTARFDDCTVTTATASDVAQGKVFVASDGTVTTGTASGGGSSGLTLIQTTSLGALSTTSTSATDTGKTITLASTKFNSYDLLIVDISVDTQTNGRHTSTVSQILLMGQSNVNTKDTYQVASNKWNSKLSSGGIASTRQSSTAYGVYLSSATVSNGTMTMTVYYRYNSNHTGTLNGTYTARIYGIKLFDLIGG